ncbi:hypothetical protein [Secundilactobacillus kimchicus]|uniref:Uncharacterized protein n=1 Tax=Secundilactobacillus kimchicus JCM 15530 TaxID=1302272 RepID=A0A0R1HXP5_9LACO|nr:hypothetical protein [Secundilactobacillus kimchicus]KRK48186.1 hypothetical protein FC96_GL001924 [Secundilactobacillus kimchicus JCM 15530]MBT9670854.1 hypothetical protein [Secundilactobacillus kimchicus]
MSVIEDLYEAISDFSTPITVHPKLNALDNDKTDPMHETISISMTDLKTDLTAEELEDPVLPRHSSVSESIAQGLGAAGSTLPRQLAWYSEHEYRAGTYVEYNGHVYQIDQIADYDLVAGIFVYYLKGDDTLAPMG